MSSSETSGPHPIGGPSGSPGESRLKFDTVGKPEDLASPKTTPFTSKGNDRTLRLEFTGGDPKCFAAHVKVQESPAEVRVQLLTGTLAELKDTPCSAVAVMAYVEVPLEQPLGTRSVVPA